VQEGASSFGVGEAKESGEVVEAENFGPIRPESHFSARGWASALHKLPSNTLTPSQKEFGAWGFAFGNGPSQVKFTGHTLSKIMPLLGTYEGTRRYPNDPYWLTALENAKTDGAPSGKCIFSRSQLLSKAECASLLQTAVQSSKNPPKARCVQPDERAELGEVLADNGAQLPSLFAYLDGQVPPGQPSKLKLKDIASLGEASGWSKVDIATTWNGVKTVVALRKERNQLFKAAQKMEGKDGDVPLGVDANDDCSTDCDVEMEDAI
jgi:hypothetical protein